MWSGMIRTYAAKVAIVYRGKFNNYSIKVLPSGYLPTYMQRKGNRRTAGQLLKDRLYSFYSCGLAIAIAYLDFIYFFNWEFLTSIAA